ncbi:hypothetical protein ACS0TY_023930 [Phlomoides rotata]
MEFTQLSLAGGQYGENTDPETPTLPMKRKWNTEAAAPPPPSVDLQMKHPLPSDWEQCLDLQTGRMYYVNRKRWTRPEEQKLDLELNISAGGHKDMITSAGECSWEDSSSSSMGNNMVALPCSNCHLLVILSRSSPSCPNCKYVHALGSSSSSSSSSIPKVPHASIGPSNWRL